MFGSSPKTQTTTESTQVPPYVQAAQQNLYQTGQTLAAPFTSDASAFGVAGFNPDQETGFELMRQDAQDAYTATPEQVTLSTTRPSTVIPNFYNMAPAAQAEFAAGTAEQLGAGDIAQFMNPYTDQVIDTTLGDMTRQFDETSAAARARLAAGGAFGGSRQAVMESALARDFGDTVARTTAGLRHQGFKTAADLGSTNAKMRQQTGLQNTQLDNQMRTWNAGAVNAREAANIDAANKFALANAAAENAMREGHANRELQAATLNNTIANDALARRQATSRALLGAGTLQQGTAQQALNLPKDWLQTLASITPGNTGSSTTKTSPSTTPSTLQQILGGGLALAGLGTGGGATLGGSLLSGLFSDEREKTDVKKLGRDPRTGVEMAAYRYKGDPKSYPKVVGPASAQQIERMMPGATREISGRKVVKPGALRAMIGA